MTDSGKYPPVQLRTARLLLRPFCGAGAPQLSDVMRAERARLLRHFPRTPEAIQDETSAASFIALREQDWAQRTTFQYGLWRPDASSRGQRCVGSVSLRGMRWTAFDVPKADWPVG